ncbi:hypothetical protein AB205_0135270, partial [Aquarana catesbeiana]
THVFCLISSPALLLICAIGSLGTIIALTIYRHQHPVNLYLLFGFTLLEAVTVGIAVTFYEVAVVIQAFILTGAVFLGLTAYTFQTKKDFSKFGAGKLLRRGGAGGPSRGRCESLALQQRASCSSSQRTNAQKSHHQRGEIVENTRGKMNKRKEREGPQKLTDFFPPVTDRLIQDGAGAGTCIPTASANMSSHPAPSGVHNELVDAHFDVEAEIKAKLLKMVDIKNRSHRNNLKFRGIPESVKPAELHSYLQKLMTTALPSLGPADIVIDRAHRLP